MRIIFFLIVMGIFNNVFAAGPPGGGGGGGCWPPEDCPVPLDGGLIFLLVAGAAYGVVKLRDKKT